MSQESLPQQPDPNEDYKWETNRTSEDIGAAERLRNFMPPEQEGELINFVGERIMDPFNKANAQLGPADQKKPLAEYLGELGYDTKELKERASELSKVWPGLAQEFNSLQRITNRETLEGKQLIQLAQICATCDQADDYDMVRGLLVLVGKDVRYLVEFASPATPSGKLKIDYEESIKEDILHAFTFGARNPATNEGRKVEARFARIAKKVKGTSHEERILRIWDGLVKEAKKEPNN